jgi:hypothetical protein
MKKLLTIVTALAISTSAWAREENNWKDSLKSFVHKQGSRAQTTAKDFSKRAGNAINNSTNKVITTAFSKPREAFEVFKKEMKDLLSRAIKALTEQLHKEVAYMKQELSTLSESVLTNKEIIQSFKGYITENIEDIAKNKVRSILNQQDIQGNQFDISKKAISHDTDEGFQSE